MPPKPSETLCDNCDNHIATPTLPRSGQPQPSAPKFIIAQFFAQLFYKLSYNTLSQRIVRYYLLQEDENEKRKMEKIII